ncbi:MAG: hypothetical protein ABW211_06710 [Acidimicrobiia bacterium]
MLIAAIEHDPKHTEGIDGALKRLLGQGLGEVAEHLMRVGLPCSGLVVVDVPHRMLPDS